MKTLRLLFVAAALLVAAAALGAGAEEKALDGSWAVVSAEEHGKPAPAQDLADAGVKFADGKMTSIQEGKAVNVYSFRVDATTRPAAIDFTGLEGPEKGHHQPGIYELKGDELKMCVSPDRKDRPTTFATEEGNDWVLLVLKRKP